MVNRGAGIRWEGRNAQTRGQEPASLRSVVHDSRLCQGLLDLSSKLPRRGTRRLRQEHRELVASKTRDQVLWATDGLSQQLGNLHQHLVPDLVALGAVEGLPMVELKQDHRGLRSGSGGQRPRLLQALQQVFSARETGQGIGAALAFHPGQAEPVL